METHIHNPYKVNWKMYGLIGVISILVMIFASFCCPNAQNVQSIIFDIIRNLSYGGVASVFIALLIEIGNVKEKNNKANNLYEMIYSDLKINISPQKRKIGYMYEKSTENKTCYLFNEKVYRLSILYSILFLL